MKLKDVIPGDDFLYQRKIYFRAIEIEPGRGVEAVCRGVVREKEGGTYEIVDDKMDGYFFSLPSSAEVIPAEFVQLGEWRVKK